MYWDNEYESKKLVWGKGPSELAIAAVRYLQECESSNKILDIVDIGCGYGRDAFYFSDNLRCRILGIDISKQAIDMASSEAFKAQKGHVIFQCSDFTELEEGKSDIVFISNLYHLLKEYERKELRKAVMRTLKPNGLLFLNTLSVTDPEHYGKGIPVPNAPHSFQDRVYLHFCTSEELINDFAFLNIKELYEHEFHEARCTGEEHHHISWILVGERMGASHNSEMVGDFQKEDIG